MDYREEVTVKVREGGANAGLRLDVNLVVVVRLFPSRYMMHVIIVKGLIEVIGRRSTCELFT